jgi:glycosyltransferase involved in cell wall biosynthesis
MNPMKILHVIENVSERYGGPQSVMGAIAKAQVAQGHQVTIATTDMDHPKGRLDVPENRPLIQNGITYIHFSVQLPALKLSWPMARHLPGLIAAHDLLHVHGLYRFPPSFAASVAWRRRSALIIRPHGSLDPFLYAQSSKSLMLKRAYETFIDFPNLRNADAIHYTADEERDRAAYLSLKTPSFVLPNGLDWDAYETLPQPGEFRASIGLAESAPLILFLGRINFKKGLDLLVPAFAKLKSAWPDAKLVIAGPDNDGYGPKVRQFISDNDVGESVIFAGMLRGAQVRAALVDATMFVLPSYSENFGMAVIESLACGTPVIISDQVNIHAQVRAAGAGLVTPCKVEDVAEAMGQFLAAPDHAAAMGCTGRQWIKDNFTWPRIVTKLDDEYRNAIDHAKNRQH